MKKQKYDESIIREAIAHFDKKENIKGLVRYQDMYRFCKLEYEKGTFPYELSEYFWRKKDRLGRILVDEYNRVSIKKLNSKASSSPVSIDIIGIFNKYYDGVSKRNKNILIQYLQNYTTQSEMMLKQLRKSTNDLASLTEEAILLKNQNKELKDKVKQLEEIIGSIFLYSKLSKLDMVNLLETSDNKKSTPVSMALKEAFNDPVAFYEEMLNSERLKNKNEDNNVVDFKSKTNDFMEEFDI